MTDEPDALDPAVVAAAGHTGEMDADTLARAVGSAAPARTRAAALGALARHVTAGRADPSVLVDTVASATGDDDPAVRRRAAEVAAESCDPRHVPALLGLLADPDVLVSEAAAFGLGEVGEAAEHRSAVVEALSAAATHHGDPLVREAAVAALGAIGDRVALPAVLAALEDRPAIRRRAVLALAPFEGEEVERALERARSDRDWQVRQAAEDLLA
ncbi:MAG TPA: HEAT repeat domain-containing protein [Acidimicrobiia bacterium]|nr:HEAT repeat domain-containing protein [Acidimicrobiia bacterium]